MLVALHPNCQQKNNLNIWKSRSWCITEYMPVLMIGKIWNRNIQNTKEGELVLVQSEQTPTFHWNFERGSYGTSS